MSRATRIGAITVIGVFVALLTAPAGVAGASTPARPPSAVPLAEITGGSSYRVIHPGEPPAPDWHSVGDETSTTVEPGAWVEVRGWWSACAVRDAAGLVLDEDAGLLAATCEVPPAAPVIRTAAPAIVGPGAELRIAPDGPGAGYSREAFGDGWVPTAPGCDTRDVVLARDLTGETVRHGCDVVAGTLRDPYTGSAVTGPARALDVDHVVPLALAWRTGAAGWTADERERFANDPANLRATVAAGNRAKGDDGPEEWLPAVDRCGYARTFAAVVERYRLTVTAARRDTIEGACA